MLRSFFSCLVTSFHSSLVVAAPALADPSGLGQDAPNEPSPANSTGPLTSRDDAVTQPPPTEAELSKSSSPSATSSAPPPTELDGAPPRQADPTYDGPPLVLNRQASVGGYGGLSVAYTRMFGQDGALLGARGGVLLDHRYSLGVAVFGWTNAQPGPDDADGNARRFEAGYGGLEIRYAFWGKLPVYASVGGLFGAGAVVLAPDPWDDENGSTEVSRDDVDVFMVAQPELTLHANLKRWMRVGITGGYRFVADIERFQLDSSDIGGPVAGLDLQFGWF